MGTRAAVAKVAGMVAVVRVVRMVVAARAAAKVEGGGGEGGGGDRGGSEGGRGDGGVDGAHHAVLAVDAVRRGAAHVAVGCLHGALRRISQSAVAQIDHRARCAEGGCAHTALIRLRDGRCAGGGASARRQSAQSLIPWTAVERER